MAKIRIGEIIDRVLAYNDRADADLLRSAYIYSGVVHRGQMRQSGEPYLIHPLAVAEILTQLRMDEVTIAAGLLHDAVEDTHATFEDIAAQCGEDVARLVEGVTKIGAIEFKTKEEQQAENFRKLVLAMSKDIRVLMIKLADRLHNMRTLRFMRPERQTAIARETLDIYAPLANRLGISWIKAELEDLSFRYLWPEAYSTLRRQMERGEREREGYVEEVVKLLKDKCDEWGVPAEVSGRPKHLYSIFLKMQRQNIAFDEIHDVIGFRILVDSTMRCYEVLGRIHGQWPPIPGRFKDYIAMPKANMYQSLHTAVIGPKGQRIEVQIRTQDMHRIAEEGIAAHWVYKEGHRVSTMSEKDERRFHWLRQLAESQRSVESSAEYLDTLRVDLFANEVYVFTPKGDVQEFPRGATPVDFAYRVHTEVGHQCAGAKVNGKIVPLRYRLRNGDTVEILTDKRHRPSKDWLEFVATGAAKTKIRAWLKNAQREKAIEIGREKLDRELRRFGHSVAKLAKSGELEKIAGTLKAANAEGLFAQVGYGRIEASRVLERLVPPEELAKPADKAEGKGRLSSLFKALAGRGDGGAVQVAGEGDVLTRFARCCTPLPGEPIVGFITRGRGVTVHTAGCEKVLAADQARIVDVSWNRDAILPQRAKVKVVSVDRPGLLAAMTKAITSRDVNIYRAIIRTTADHRAVNDFELEITDLAQLHDVMRNLERVKGVIEVERI